MSQHRVGALVGSVLLAALPLVAAACTVEIADVVPAGTTSTGGGCDAPACGGPSSTTGTSSGDGGANVTGVGGAGAGGAPAAEVLYEGDRVPLSLAVDDQHAYFLCGEETTDQRGSICRVAKIPEGPPETTADVLSAIHDAVYDLAVTEDALHWCQPGELWTYDKAGDTTTSLEDASWDGDMQYVAVDAASAYCTPVNGASSDAVVRIQLDGEGSSLLPELGIEEPSGIHVAGGALYVIKHGSSERITTLDPATDEAWTTYLPRGWVARLASDPTHLYFTRVKLIEEHATPGVVRVRLGFAGSESLLVEGESPWGLAVDGDDLYATFEDGRVVASRLDGSGQELVHEGPPGRGDVAVDATHVYWTNDTARTVMRRARRP